MEKIEIKIRHYQPNPQLPDFRSRFLQVEKIKDEQGNEFTAERIRGRIPKIPVTRFIYDPQNISGYFEPVSDESGNPGYRTGREMQPYIPSPELIELVRLAQILQRPVLIKGEPGSGKTMLARSVAYEWYGDDYLNHYFEWPIKSTSKAVDGLYHFDHVARLRKAQLSKSMGIHEEKEDLTQYRTFGPMAKAFLTSTSDNPSILLIDEIDKADIDFPNDLLLELDERRFTIPASETGEAIVAKYPPVIFITSNDERELPEAFLRRCLFMYIKFPDEEQLKSIIKAQIPGLIEQYADFVQAAIQRFNGLREEIRNDPADNKRVSTSELLDWLRAYQFDILSNREIVTRDMKNLPFYYQALLKTFAAVNRREQQIEKEQINTR